MCVYAYTYIIQSQWFQKKCRHASIIESNGDQDQEQLSKKNQQRLPSLMLTMVWPYLQQHLFPELLLTRLPVLSLEQQMPQGSQAVAL